MKIVSFLLCIVMVLGLFTGCVVKPSGPSATGESYPAASAEVTKENTSENTPETIQPTEEKPPIDKEDKKEEKEETPEFYDFMTLDPEPEWNFESSEEYEIRQYNYNRMYGYLDTGKWTFTKKEVYYAHIDSIRESNCYLGIYFKKGKNDFYSKKTREKLEKLGFQFRKPYSLYDDVTSLYENDEIPFNGDKDRTEALKEAFKIVLEDHNVALVDTWSNPSAD